MEELLKKKVIVVSYVYQNFRGEESYLSGPAQDLVNYLKKKTETLVFIKQPNPISEDLKPRALVFKKGELKKTFILSGLPQWVAEKIRRSNQEAPLIYFLFKIRDFFAVFYFFIMLRQRFDLFVGVESPDCLAGIILKKIGAVKKVVYDVIDYSPQRFKNSFLNNIFHFLDKICLAFSDFSWSQTERVIAQRNKRWKNIRSVQMAKPTGIEEKKIRKLPLGEIDRFSIIYAGTLLERDGVELIFDALPFIVEKFKEAKVVLIGSGGLEEKLRAKVREDGLERNCSFLGLISDAARVEDILRHGAIAVAPYLIKEDSVKFYNDPSKPKLYLSCALPVVITRMPVFSREIERAGAGKVINYDRREFADAVIALLKDDKLLEEYRHNAVRLVSKYTWENIFDEIFSKMYLKI